MLNTALLAATTVFASTCTLPAGDITSPYTWGNYFLDKYEAERIEAMNLDEAPPAGAPIAQPRTVLLITGVTIPGEWFDPIKARLERDGFNPVVYEPPALLSGDLFANSQALGQVIANIRAQTGEQKIDILAECTGGLIARHYMQSLGGDQYVSRMITFISPQHGLPKAATAQSFVDWDAVKDLTPGSDFLEAVNNAPLPNVPITSIYTCTDEYIQPYKTSIIPGAKNIGVACDGKSFIGHFQFFYDREIYKLMFSELVAPLPNQPQDPSMPSDDPEDEATTDDNAASGCSTSNTTSGLAMFAVLGAALVLVRRRRR